MLLHILWSTQPVLKIPYLFTGERPFKCPFEGCTRSFTTSNIRKVHIRTHTGERPYICPEEGCGRAFASATNYKNHVRIHTGTNPLLYLKKILTLVDKWHFIWMFNTGKFIMIKVTKTYNKIIKQIFSPNLFVFWKLNFWFNFCELWLIYKGKKSKLPDILSNI